MTDRHTHTHSFIHVQIQICSVKTATTYYSVSPSSFPSLHRPNYFFYDNSTVAQWVSGSIYAEPDVIYCFCIFVWICFFVFFSLFDCFPSCHLLCRCACVLSLHLFPNLLIRAPTQSVSGSAFIMTSGKGPGYQPIISFSLVYICLDSSSVS